MVDVWCADDKRADFGEMGPDVVHAMAVATFYDKRMDQRIAALNLLERYDCQTKADCEELLYLLDWGIKSGRPQIFSKDIARRANKLRDQTRIKLKNSFNNQIPSEKKSLAIPSYEEIKTQNPSSR